MSEKEIANLIRRQGPTVTARLINNLDNQIDLLVIAGRKMLELNKTLEKRITKLEQADVEHINILKELYHKADDTEKAITELKDGR